MDWGVTGFPVLHHLLEFAQTHAHWVSDAIQPSHPLLPPSLPAFNLSQHQALFQWVSSSHQVAKVLEFQLQHQSFQWIFRTDFLQDWQVWSCSPRDSQESSPTPHFKNINSLVLSFLYGPTLTFIHDYWKNQCSASGKEFVCQCRRHKRYGFDPWVEKIPWSRKWHPLQYSCLENCMGRGAWWVTVHEATESWARLSTQYNIPRLDFVCGVK